MGKVEGAPMKARNYHIERVPEGGFIVWPLWRSEGLERLPLFACTDINDALKYIKKGFGA